VRPKKAEMPAALVLGLQRLGALAQCFGAVFYGGNAIRA
jgi:hypothetical protein